MINRAGNVSGNAVEGFNVAPISFGSAGINQ
jgi:hypothetical protein